jgi:hypothetical protein
MSADPLHFAGVVLTTVPAIAFGCARLLRTISGASPDTSITRCALPLASPRAENPSRLNYLVPLGGLSLSLGAWTPGFGLLSA